MAYFEDYMDADTAYLTGLLIARGTLEATEPRRLIIQFPFSSIHVTGISTEFDQETSIRLGITDIRERLADLLETDIKIVYLQNSINLVAIFNRNSMIWRNLLAITNGATSYPYFSVPEIFFKADTPRDWKKEFIKGYGDAAGNVRKSNRYVDGRYRVRLDVLNKPTNWEVPIKLCHLLQEEIDIPVRDIMWGHPNLNRGFREHQINIFADSYLAIGFTFVHKQKILEELAERNRIEKPNIVPSKCPGIRDSRKYKSLNPAEHNADKLDERLVAKHFDSYWQICKALGCNRMP